VEEYGEFLKNVCPLTCGLCRAEASRGEACMDSAESIQKQIFGVPDGQSSPCVQARNHCGDVVIGELISSICPLTCGLCQACEVKVYEHWPEGIDESMANLSAEMRIGINNWSPNFPTGHTEIFNGVGNFALNATSGLVSSVKVTGTCCKAYGYVDVNCTSGAPFPIGPSGNETEFIVAPASNLVKYWSCNDCARCIKIEQGCS